MKKPTNFKIKDKSSSILNQMRELFALQIPSFWLPLSPFAFQSSLSLFISKGFDFGPTLITHTDEFAKIIQHIWILLFQVFHYISSTSRPFFIHEIINLCFYYLFSFLISFSR